MYVKDQRGWVSRSNDRTGQNENGKDKGSESSELASTEEIKRYTEVYGVGKLLQILCKKLYKVL